MVGYPPASGRSANLRSVIVPLRMHFVYFEQDAVFDPDKAVNNIRKSPMFRDGAFPNGVGQFGDMLQRATLWNKMDPQRRWHVTMDRPRIAPTVDVLVEPDIGELLQLSSDPNDIIGNIRIGAMDSTIHTILQLTDIGPDESWLEPALVGDLLADVSTFNHELGEWLNDPYVNNIVPDWTYPPLNTECSFNPYPEVGDPQGNGPQFFDFPTVPIPLNGYTYHLQNLVMLPWFTGEVPSSAQSGWYDFPDTKEITKPFVPCTP